MLKLPPRPNLKSLLHTTADGHKLEVKQEVIKKTKYEEPSLKTEHKSEPTVKTEHTLNKPKQILEFYDDFNREDAFAKVEKHFLDLSRTQKLKPLLLVGPTGSGKTALIEYYASKNNIKLEFADDPDEDSFNSSFFKGPLVLDSLETLDPAFKLLLKKYVQLGRRSLIITAEDRFADCVKALQKHTNFVCLEKPSKQFIKSILLKKNCSEALAEEIAVTANGNLGVALAATYWTSKTLSKSGASQMFTESPLDVQKATRALLIGQKLACIGDVSFLLHQVQNNTVPVASLAGAHIKVLAKAMDSYSLLDIMDHKKWFTTEELWSAMESTVNVGPKLTTNTNKFSYEWPKSLKKLEPAAYVFA